MGILLDQYGNTVTSMVEWNAFAAMVAKIHGLKDSATFHKKEFAWFMGDATFTFCNLSASIYAQSSEDYNFTFYINIFDTEKLFCWASDLNLDESTIMECGAETTWQELEEWAAQFNHDGNDHE